MFVPEVITFQEAIKRTEGEDRALLIGNGFSAQYFSYADLLTEAGLEADSSIRNLFANLDTVDFEAVVRALEDAVIVEQSYGNVGHANELGRDAQGVRDALVHAVKATHPEHRADLIFQYESAATFLDFFREVFSLNYDLLLYWISLERGILSDGFGQGEVSQDRRFRGPFKEGARCSVFNLHGGLHLFQDNVGDIHKALNHGDGVVANISEQISAHGKMPLYVAEGSWQSKLRKINSSSYLRHCYRQLKDNTDPVFVYGHSAAENDSHIYDAIFKSGVRSVYFGIFQPNKEKVRVIDAQLSKYKKLAGDTVPYTLFASDTANVWGEPNNNSGEQP